MTTEKETCKACGKEIAEGDELINVELGRMEYLEDDGNLFPMNQCTENMGYWHKACFPGKIIE